MCSLLNAAFKKIISSKTGGSRRKCGNPNQVINITKVCKPMERVTPSLIQNHSAFFDDFGLIKSSGKASISFLRVAISVRRAMTWIPAFRISPATTAIAP